MKKRLEEVKAGDVITIEFGAEGNFITVEVLETSEYDERFVMIRTAEREMIGKKECEVEVA